MAYNNSLELLISDDTSVDVLKVKHVDFHHKENGLRHHTSRYDVMVREKKQRLVIRRAQEFLITIHFNRFYDKDFDGVSLVFVISGKEILFWIKFLA